jgi:DMSO/TMAO reductase YedYZ molybdopterin-dependent catalytic subunit
MSPKVNRRGFVTSSAAAVLAIAGWKSLRPAMSAASRFNDRFSEVLGVSGGPPLDPGRRTTSFPNYHISADTPVAPAGWQLEVGGLVRTPLKLSLADVRALPRVNETWEHHCVEGWSAIATWAGAPLSVIAQQAGIKPEARYVRFDSFDEDYYNGWDLASALHKTTIIAYAFNDRELMPDHGAPLRLYSPSKLGYKLTKYLTTITFTAEKPGGYWEDQGYPWFGGV